MQGLLVPGDTLWKEGIEAIRIRNAFPSFPFPADELILKRSQSNVLPPVL
jgi:hypothetical protein